MRTQKKSTSNLTNPKNLMIESLEQRFYLWAPNLTGGYNPDSGYIKINDGAPVALADVSSTLITSGDRTRLKGIIDPNSALVQSYLKSNTGTLFDKALYNYMSTRTGVHYFFENSDVKSFVDTIAPQSPASRNTIYEPGSDRAVTLEMDPANQFVDGLSQQIGTATVTYKVFKGGSPSIYVVPPSGTQYVDWSQPLTYVVDSHHDIVEKDANTPATTYPSSYDNMNDVTRGAFNKMIDLALAYVLHRDNPNFSDTVSKYLNEIRSILRSWAYENPPVADTEVSSISSGNASNWKFSDTNGYRAAPNWNPNETALRLQSMMTVYNLLLNTDLFKDESKGGPSFHTMFVVEMYNHANLIARAMNKGLTDVDVVKGANKAVTASSALATFCRMFPEFKNSSSWDSLSGTRFAASDTNNYTWNWNTMGPDTTASKRSTVGVGDYVANTSDGLQIEQSPNYANDALGQELDQIILVARSGDTSSGIAKVLTKDTVAKRVEALFQLATPDDYMTEFGDTPRKSLNETFAEAAVIVPTMPGSISISSIDPSKWPKTRVSLQGVLKLWKMTGGPSLASASSSIGTSFTRPVKEDLAGGSTAKMLNAASLPASGFFVLRGNDANSSGTTTQDVQMVFKAGRPGFKATDSDGHGQYDNLSIDLTGYGRPLIEDPGIVDSTYPSNDPLRAWAETATAHNTVTVDAFSPARTNSFFGFKKPGLMADSADFSTDSHGTSTQLGTVKNGVAVTGWEYGYMDRAKTASTNGPVVARTVWAENGDSGDAEGEDANEHTYIIVDWMRSNDGKAHNFASSFLLPVTQPSGVSIPWGKQAGAIVGDAASGWYTNALGVGNGNVYIDSITPQFSSFGAQTEQVLGLSSKDSKRAHVTDPSGQHLSTNAPAAQIVVTQSGVNACIITLIHTAAVQSNSQNPLATASELPTLFVAKKNNARDQDASHVTLNLTVNGLTRKISFVNPMGSSSANAPLPWSSGVSIPLPAKPHPVTSALAFPLFYTVFQRPDPIDSSDPLAPLIPKSS